MDGNFLPLKNEYDQGYDLGFDQGFNDGFDRGFIAGYELSAQNEAVAIAENSKLNTAGHAATTENG